MFALFSSWLASAGGAAAVRGAVQGADAGGDGVLSVEEVKRMLAKVRGCCVGCGVMCGGNPCWGRHCLWSWVWGGVEEVKRMLAKVRGGDRAGCGVIGLKRWGDARVRTHPVGPACLAAGAGRR